MSEGPPGKSNKNNEARDSVEQQQQWRRRECAIKKELSRKSKMGKANNEEI